MIRLLETPHEAIKKQLLELSLKYHEDINVTYSLYLTIGFGLQIRI